MALTFVFVAAAALGLLSSGRAAPLSDCQRLNQQIDIQGRDQLLGKWYHQGEATNMTGVTFLTKALVSSVTVTLTAAEESDTLNVLQNQKMLNRCFSVRAKLILANSSLSLVYHVPATEVLLSTSCPDCLVIYITYNMGGSAYRGLQFLSKRTRVTDAELEEFKKQVECLNLPPPAIISSDEADHCPDESNDADGGAFDVTDISPNISQKVLQALDRTLNSEGGVGMILEWFTSSLSGPK